MIDKNDVRMPAQRENIEEIQNNGELVAKIEKLLEMVNSVDNKQELRLKEKYYSRFHWFGGSHSDSAHSYYSYQEEAVYDFIFMLNKSGILSDQVGMGKTIEAGMIISELASRNELRSLLIIVPNEIMASKWEDELENKFGIKEHIVRDEFGKEKQVYPKAKTIKNLNDFYRCVFGSVSKEKFSEFSQHKFEHTYTGNDEDDKLQDVLYGYVKEDIKKVVELINIDFEDNEITGNPTLSFNGKNFVIKNFGLSHPYVLDENGEISNYVKRKRGKISSIINNRRFNNEYKKILDKELEGLCALIGKFITTIPEEITKIAVNMTSSNNYPILIIPKEFSEYSGDKAELKEFLNCVLLDEIKDYKHTYCTQNESGEILPVNDPYRIVDFFIDAGYQTLIIDEVHDYIDVETTINRNIFHNDPEKRKKYNSTDYNRYELFDDYHFIKKSSLFKKLKSLADKANRKIFLTATPIKSDMVDFYLLTLIASNKDSDAYKKTSEALERDYAYNDELKEEAITELYNSFKTCVEATSAEYFKVHSNVFFALAYETENEKGSNLIKSSRCKYPYFNNAYLRQHVNDEKLIREYLLSQMSYLTMEEIVIELILAYNAERETRLDSVKETISALNDLFMIDEGSSLQTRVVFRSLLNNVIRIRFEEDFTKDNGEPIKRIRELLELEDGPRRWHKTYRKYGIRHTRHQTYNLSDCQNLSKLNKNKQDRYKNLPVWPRRNGKVIFLLRDDVFFDNFIEVKRKYSPGEDDQLKIEDLPNYDRLKGKEEEKQERFKDAVNIFDYINNSMSGGDEHHMPLNSRYQSIGLDDNGMVDYKLALVNKLMLGSDNALGSISGKVLLFAEKDRDAILEWFRYQKCAPLYVQGEGNELIPEKLETYKKKWESYNVDSVEGSWRVTSKAENLKGMEGNVLIVIDPKRYEKGVDLQQANTIINFDLNYCPLKMEQRIGRIDRIRPAEQERDINIISFVPYNNMSGFVINFFANEMKMFTQWMGETTGIVSVPEEDGKGRSAEKVAFEDKVTELEEHYCNIYKLCKEDVKAATIADMADKFEKTYCGDFSQNEKAQIKVDFDFINQLRSDFNDVFLNSLSPENKGYSVHGSQKKVIRFNTTMSVLESVCEAESCERCPNRESCGNKKRKVNNQYPEFVKAINAFLKNGNSYWTKAISRREKYLGDSMIGSASTKASDSMLQTMKMRQNAFADTQKEIQQKLPDVTEKTFTMDFDQFMQEIFLPVKKLYWDDVVNKYIAILLEKFYKQCDSVLQSAKLFEKFIKNLSIADFINNMEGKM